MVRFPYDKKRANVVMWKDTGKEYEYISKAGSLFFACEMSAEKNVEQSCTVRERTP